MCGICGHVRPTPASGGPGQADLAALAPLLGLLAHRGPDQTDSWLEPGGAVALGHTRLSILDLDPRAGQPMHDPHTGNVIVFNGEIYNFRALRTALEEQGEVFRTTGDTEVLLALYRLHGRDCLPLLRGMFAFALWDAGRRELFLARDRLGKKPLVYFDGPPSANGGGLVFASELRALRAHPLCPAGGSVHGLDPEALDLYLSLGYVPAPRTILKGVRKLPPAHCAVYGQDGLRVWRWWDVDYREKLDVSEAEALDLAWDCLRESVRLRLESDVPLGLLLSGGVDSSLVAAVLADLSPGQARAFSIGFDEKKYNELPHAQTVASHLGLNLTHEIMPAATLEALPEVALRYGEPYADDSALPSLFLSRMARKHITVALGGDGGDELALGYPTYRHAKVASAIHSLLPLSRPKDESLRRLASTHTDIARARREFLAANLWPETKPLLRTEPRLWPLKARLYTPEARQRLAATYADWFLPWLDRSFEHAANPVERMLYIDNATCLPDDLLVKMDIASMAASLEVRSPLLDHKLIELFAALPVGLKVHRGETKHLLKKMAERVLPKHVLYRRKQGFDLPIREWMAGPMHGFVMDALASADPGLAEHLNMDAAKAIAREHAEGKNRKNMLWRLLVLALWSRAR
ncbi:MAG: asparagine synthase (glutamine-hydrolyzing) [Humidesulfovibrio sp.]|uniref:asparagine synthase (glutamine-hydrolyzing) n=1 Tax=Humidesulfovibrio sp. TaxID=2910988 RepID=UPI0027FE2FB6|nr:asparagine synthase (glutamine-hydrolyzing) [Humidesulfovibrio sp.]MDQ7835518.1 asparagine synthase (glutamine-hydrolyzing) [Humidesulfovibrio sp.]